MNGTHDSLFYLQELRTRLWRCLIAYGLLFGFFCYTAQDCFTLLAKPLVAVLPQNSQLIATQITTPVFLPIRLAMMLAFLTNLPVVLYHFWKFIAPALHPQEKKNIIPLFMSSLMLLILGGLFTYFLVLPLLFQFFIVLLPPEVALMADINQYLDLILWLFLLFGCIFQIPLIMLFLLTQGWITVDHYIEKRPYFVIAAFVIAMLATPPDVLAMIVVATPICLLYEIGILLGRYQRYKMGYKTRH
jgi:sec-independent protein translocase protein TatC